MSENLANHCRRRVTDTASADGSEVVRLPHVAENLSLLFEERADMTMKLPRPTRVRPVENGERISMIGLTVATARSLAQSSTGARHPELSVIESADFFRVPTRFLVVRSTLLRHPHHLVMWVTGDRASCSYALRQIPLGRRPGPVMPDKCIDPD